MTNLSPSPEVSQDVDRPQWVSHRVGLPPTDADASYTHLYRKYRPVLVRQFIRRGNRDAEDSAMLLLLWEYDARDGQSPPEQPFGAYMYWQVRAKCSADRRRRQPVLESDLSGRESKDLSELAAEAARQHLDDVLADLKADRGEHLAQLSARFPALSGQEAIHAYLRIQDLDCAEIAEFLDWSVHNERTRWSRLRRTILELYKVDLAKIIKDSRFACKRRRR